MKNVINVVLGAVFLVAGHSFAKDALKASSFKEALTSAPAAELPATAAELVLHAKSRDRAVTTIEVVKTAVRINPAAAPAIVGAIARSVPDMASIAAGAAAAEQPRQAAAIAKAAAAAAPSKARKVVTAVCLAVPNEYRNIAVAVAEAVPTASKEIVKGVEAALPDMQLSIEQTLAAYRGNVPTVADTLDQAARLSQSRTTPAAALPTPAGNAAATTSSGLPGTRTRSTPAATASTTPVRGPAVGPPYIPLSNTPTNVTPGSSGQVPEGGRNYAAP
jgi:hypothetical protein